MAERDCEHPYPMPSAEHLGGASKLKHFIQFTDCCKRSQHTSPNLGLQNWKTYTICKCYVFFVGKMSLLAEGLSSTGQSGSGALGGLAESLSREPPEGINCLFSMAIAG